MLNAFRDPCVGAVVTRLLNSDGTLQPSCIRAPRPFDLISEDLAFAARFPTWQRPRRYRMLDWDHREARPVDAARGACLFIWRGAIADVGPFDELFFLYYEETDWLIRAKRRGWRTVFLPTVEAVHTSAGSSPDVRSRNDLLLLESQHRYARKHFGGRRPRSFARRSSASIRHVSPATRSAVEARRGPRQRTASASTSRCALPDPHSPVGRLFYILARGGGPADWGRLAERAGHVFATREWLLTWWRHYGKARRQLIGLARADGDLVAIVPLYEWWQRGIRYCASSVTDRAIGSGRYARRCRDGALDVGVAQTLHAVPLRRFVLLAEQVAGDQRFGDLTGARSLYREASPMLRFEHDSWDEFVRARGRNFRQQARRFPRKLSELGNVSYRLTTDPERLQLDLDTLFRLHRQRWGSMASAFLVAEPFHREFATPRVSSRMAATLVPRD